MKTILWADNDVDFLNTYAELLEQAGFKVYRAYSPAEARRILAEEYVHLAILDLRLTNDDDLRDVSGLTLAKDPLYLHLPKIMLSGFPTYQAARAALGPAMEGLPPAVDFMSKDEIGALVPLLERVFARYVRINGQLKITTHGGEPQRIEELLWLIEPRLDSGLTSARTEELKDLLCKLFNVESEIIVERQLWNRDRRACMVVAAHRPDDTHQDYVMTLGPIGEIRTEVQAYRDRAPQGILETILDLEAQTQHYGAVRYLIPGTDHIDSIQTINERYLTVSEKQIREIIRALLSQTLAAWNKDVRLPRQATLDQLCQEPLDLLGISWPDVAERGCELARKAQTLGRGRLELSPEHLALFLADGRKPVSSNPFTLVGAHSAPSDASVLCHISPGLLSGENVLVDAKGASWLTDFRYAGLLPMAWDYASLEMVARLEWARSDSLLDLYDLEECLTRPAGLNMPLQRDDTDRRFGKALGAIEEIRSQAFGALGVDEDLYHRAILLQMLAVVERYETGRRYTPPELAYYLHALLAAAMTAERLFGAEAPAQSGPPDEPGVIRLDGNTGAVWVGSKRKMVSPDDFLILRHLYHLDGEVCSEREIITEALEQTYMGDQTEKSRITSAIWRIRGKIEPNPSKPIYLRNRRQKGYYLSRDGKEREPTQNE